MRNGRVIPSPLRIVTPNMATFVLLEPDREGQQTTGGGNAPEQFEAFAACLAISDHVHLA